MMTKDDVKQFMAAHWLSEIDRFLPKGLEYWEKHFVAGERAAPVGEGRLRLVLYTEEHQYYITVRPPEGSYTDHEKLPERGEDATPEAARIYSETYGYLGATVSARKAQPGEVTMGGRDLPDGPFCRATWDKIVQGILAFELLPIVERYPKIMTLKSSVKIVEFQNVRVRRPVLLFNPAQVRTDKEVKQPLDALLEVDGDVYIVDCLNTVRETLKARGVQLPHPAEVSIAKDIFYDRCDDGTSKEEPAGGSAPDVSESEQTPNTDYVVKQKVPEDPEAEPTRG